MLCFLADSFISSIVMPLKDVINCLAACEGFFVYCKPCSSHKSFFADAVLSFTVNGFFSNRPSRHVAKNLYQQRLSSMLSQMMYLFLPNNSDTLSILPVILINHDTVNDTLLMMVNLVFDVDGISCS